MIVVDASLVLDLIIVTPAAKDIQLKLAAADKPLHAPEVLDLEVLQALRRQLRLKHLSPERAGIALEIFNSLPIKRESHQRLIARIWALRDNLTAYDAAYIALAEAMEAPVWTRDRKYVGAAIHRAEVVVL